MKPNPTPPSMDATPATTLPSAHYSAQLQALLDRQPLLRGAVLTQTDGFEIASASRDGLPAARLAALASSMAALGDAALREIGLAGSDSVLIEGRDGKLLLLDVPHAHLPLVLAVIGDAALVTGTLLWAARDCVRQIVHFTNATEQYA